MNPRERKDSNLLSENLKEDEIGYYELKSNA